MYAPIEIGAMEHHGRSAQSTTHSATAARRPAAKAAARCLATGEFLFHGGDLRRRAFRVERGALCHYMQWSDGHHEVIGFAFPGDIIGFGHLERHVSTAQAMVDTEVVDLSDEVLNAALARDAELAARMTAQGDREFDYLKDKAVTTTAGDDERRVAAFILALAAMAGRESGGAVVTGAAPTGASAGALGLSVDALAQILKRLEERALIAPDGDSLRILDLAGLEALSG